MFTFVQPLDPRCHGNENLGIAALCPMLQLFEILSIKCVRIAWSPRRDATALMRGVSGVDSVSRVCTRMESHIFQWVDKKLTANHSQNFQGL